MKTYEELVEENKELIRNNGILARAAKHYKEEAEKYSTLSDMLGGDLRAAVYGEWAR